MNNDNSGYIKIIIAAAVLSALVGIILLINSGKDFGSWNWKGNSGIDINGGYNSELSNKGNGGSGSGNNGSGSGNGSGGNGGNSGWNNGSGGGSGSGSGSGSGGNGGNSGWNSGSGSGNGSGSGSGLKPSEEFRNESLFNLLLAENSLNFGMEKDELDDIEINGDYISDYGAGVNAFYLEQSHADGEFVYFECLDFVEQTNTFIYAYEVTLKNGATAVRLMSHNYETGDYQIIFSEDFERKSKAAVPYNGGGQSLFAQKVIANGGSSYTNYGYSRTPDEGKYMVYYNGSCYFFKWDGSEYKLFKYADAAPLINESYELVKEKVPEGYGFKQLAVNSVKANSTFSKVYLSVTASKNTVEADNMQAETGMMSKGNDWEGFFKGESGNDLYQSTQNSGNSQSVIDNIEQEIEDNADEISKGELNYVIELTIKDMSGVGAFVGRYDSNYATSYNNGIKTVKFSNVYNGDLTVYNSDGSALQTIGTGVDISGCYISSGVNMQVFSGEIASVSDSSESMTAYLSDISCLTSYEMFSYEIYEKNENSEDGGSSGSWETLSVDMAQWKNDIILFSEDSDGISKIKDYQESGAFFDQIFKKPYKPFVLSSNNDESIYGVFSRSSDGNRVLAITSENIYITDSAPILVQIGLMKSDVKSMLLSEGDFAKCMVIPLSVISGADDINSMSGNNQEVQKSTKMTLDVGNGKTVDLTSDAAKDSNDKVNQYNKYINKEGQMDFVSSAEKMQGVSNSVYGGNDISVSDGNVTISNVNIEAPNIYLRPENIIFMGDNTFIITSTDIGIVKCSVTDGKASAIKMADKAYFQTWKLNEENRYLSIGFNQEGNAYSRSDLPFAKAITYKMRSADKQIEYNKIEKLVYESIKQYADGLSNELTKYKSKQNEIEKYYASAQKSYITACVFSKMTTGNTTPSDWAKLSRAATARIGYLAGSVKSTTSELNTEYADFIDKLMEYSDRIYEYCNGGSAAVLLSADGKNISGAVKEYLRMSGSAAENKKREIMTMLSTERTLSEIISQAGQTTDDYEAKRAEISSAALNFDNAAKAAADREALLYQKSILSSSGVNSSVKSSGLAEYENKIAALQQSIISYTANGLVQTGESGELCRRLISGGMSKIASYISSARNLSMKINANNATDAEYTEFTDNITMLKEAMESNINSRAMHDSLGYGAKTISYDDDFKSAADYFRTAYMKTLEIWKLEHGQSASGSKESLQAEINAAKISADMHVQNIKNTVFGE